MPQKGRTPSLKFFIELVDAPEKAFPEEVKAARLDLSNLTYDGLLDYR